MYITFFFYLAKKCICTVDKRFVIPIVDVDSVCCRLQNKTSNETAERKIPHSSILLEGA